MRPRHKAAEYRSGCSPAIRTASRASMRPRHKAAEYRRTVRTPGLWFEDASMRPRHKAAEYGQPELNDFARYTVLQ